MAAAVTSTTATTITTAAAAPTALQGSGQFRIVVDSEIMIVTAGATGTSWTVTRGAEGSTAATHLSGVSVYHDLTAGALTNLLSTAGPVSSVFGRTGAVTAASGDYTVSEVTGAAPLASPTFTGTPAAPTAAANDDSTKIATTAYVDGSYTPTTERVNSVASSGSSQTIPAPQTDTINRIVLSAGCTLTFPTAAAGKSFMLQVVQPSSGGPYAITWPGSGVVWVAGSAPTQATAASKRDLYSFVCVDGTNWEGVQVSPSGGY